MKFWKALFQKNRAVTAVLIILFISLLVIYGFIFSNSQILNQSSTATISVNSNMLNVHFNITTQDLPQAKRVLAKLGGSEFNDLNIEIDSNSAKKLSQFLPVTVNLDFNSNSVQFDGNDHGLLVSSLPRTEVSQQNYSISTGSANLSLQSGNQIDLKVQYPDRVLNYATSSGQLQVSEKLSPVLTVLGKIDTIEVHSANNKVSGEILLKSD